MAARSGSGGSGTGPGPGPAGARRGSAGRDAENEVRELVSAVPANRLCFECGQRGVTYAAICVGSLVCSGRSGAL